MNYYEYKLREEQEEKERQNKILEKKAFEEFQVKIKEALEEDAKPENESADDGNVRKDKKSTFLKELLRDVVIAIVIVLAITSVFKPTIVKEESMLDTLQENNYLFINKLAYKFKDHPENGDIIVFKSNLINGETGEDMLLIKRVIGVEGDVIMFKNNEIYRNGKAIVESYIYDEPSEVRNYPNGKTIKVGKDKVFAMGDHRSVSRDSRDSTVGLIDEDAIVGKAVLRLYPLNEICLL